MIDFKPDRLGHCCYLTDEQLEEVHSKKIHVEICPTSNLAAVPEAARTLVGLRHLKKLNELNANYTICCDDTMLFSSNLSTEMFEYANSFQKDSQHLKDQMVKGVDACFCDDKTKEWLRETIDRFKI